MTNHAAQLAIIKHVTRQESRSSAGNCQADEPTGITQLSFGFSLANIQMEGLGADDKNGIWIALKCLQRYGSIKCCFFVQEEVGCIGSSKCDMDFFSDCRFVLQCDRRGGSDLIPNIGGWTELASKEFLDAINYEAFGYKTTTGMMTDVEALKNRGLEVSALNMSCGYYRPHTDEEYTKKTELYGCLGLVQHIIETCQDVYPHKEEFGYYGKTGNLYDDSDYDELWDQMANFLSYYPEATREEVLDEFTGLGGYRRDLVEMTYEDVKSLYF